ncbi:hypothetical protein STA3757_27320 [Stanieria sp. NIES-3757]|nr:hypothetical protein STA3757_27320 [Stanieria sp. NIES-3757]
MSNKIEFMFRDSQQFTGLADCQARDLTKLDFHLLERFIDKLNLDPTCIKSHPNYSNLCD